MGGGGGRWQNQPQGPGLTASNMAVGDQGTVAPRGVNLLALAIKEIERKGVCVWSLECYLFLGCQPTHPNTNISLFRVLKLHPREAAPNSSCTQKPDSSSKFRVFIQIQVLHPSGPPGGEENDMIIINFLSTANGRMWYKKMWMKMGPGVWAGGRGSSELLQTLSPLCRVFSEVFLFRDGGGEGDETGRVLFVVFAIAVVGSIVCVVESLFLLCVH